MRQQRLLSFSHCKQSQLSQKPLWFASQQRCPTGGGPTNIDGENKTCMSLLYERVTSTTRVGKGKRRERGTWKRVCGRGRKKSLHGKNPRYCACRTRFLLVGKLPGRHGVEIRQVAAQKTLVRALRGALTSNRYSRTQHQSRHKRYASGIT